MKLSFTHAELVQRAKRWLVNTKGCGFCLSEMRCYNNSGEIPDAIGWRYASSHLIECKTSRGDFFADAKKIFRRDVRKGIGNYRYYMTEPNLIIPDELPERWGLLYVYKTQVRQIVKPERFGHKEVPKVERPLLCSALRRVHLQGDLEKIYDYDTLYRERQ
jgi:hypothetical protein